MGYRLNRLDGPVFMAGPKLTGIHQLLESFAAIKRCTAHHWISVHKHIGELQMQIRPWGLHFTLLEPATPRCRWRTRFPGIQTWGHIAIWFLPRPHPQPLSLHHMDRPAGRHHHWQVWSMWHFQFLMVKYSFAQRDCIVSKKPPRFCRCNVCRCTFLIF